MPVNAEGFKGGDRTTIELPAIQRRLISELKKLGKPIIFVNYSGSAVGLEPESKICDAILQAWYPGQAGGTAVADVLLATTILRVNFRSLFISIPTSFLTFKTTR